MHAAQVVAGHVAEELVVPGGEVQPQLPAAARLAGLERTDDDRLEPLLADRRAVSAKRQPRALADDDQLMSVGAAVANGKEQIARADMSRGRDPEVALGDANDCAGFVPAASAAGAREQRERREYEEPQRHPYCFDRYEVPRSDPNGGGPPLGRGYRTSAPLGRPPPA